MKKYILAGFFGLLSLTSCETSNESSQVVSKDELAKTDKENSVSISSDGYELMKQNCFVCHLEKRDRSKKSSMIAPPIERVQEHYKSSFTDKESFVLAVKNWIKSPSEEKILMPGAVRKFGMMPPLSLADEKLEKIAAALYDADFEKTAHGKRMFGKKLILNNGKKWKLNKLSMNKLRQTIENLKALDNNDISVYRQQGKEIFDAAKVFLLDKSYNENTLQQIQLFFHDIEDDMHHLMVVKNISEARKYQKILIQKFEEFNLFFE